MAITIDTKSDIMDVKRVETFTSGPFYFSRRYDRQALTEKLEEARVLQQVVAEMPILPSLASRIEEEAIIKSIYGTAALEGNPLSEEEVGEIITATDPARSRQRARQEIENLKECYSMLKEFGTLPDGLELNHELIKNIHQLITNAIEHHSNQPGRFREHKVQVGNLEHGGVYTPPKIFDDISNLMNEFVAWINSPELLAEPPLVRGALGHYHLAMIHPFSDGNGRTARFVEAMVMRTGGVKHVPLMLSNYYYRHMDDYYWAFSLTRKHKNREVTPFLDFVLSGFIESIWQIQKDMTYYIRRFTLREYYSRLAEKKDITRRQHELLKVLLDRKDPFALRELWTTSPFSVLYMQVSERTGRRDLDSLVKRNLLTKHQDKTYTLNLRLLDAI